ncbi:MAG: hypothetical protein IKV09_03245 [Alistipes sp.]|nr:hypothetical protein [Alistipes sp.]
MIKKILLLTAKVFATILLLLLLAICVTGVSPIYDFAEPKPFAGDDIFNPYASFDASQGWKRANFHTHTKVEGTFNECDHTPAEVDKMLRAFGYDIVTFSNHNALTQHPYSEELQVNLYEHGYNLFKFHKLVFGAKQEMRFDHLLPILASQKQFQLNLLGAQSDFLQLNHPLRTHTMDARTMQQLTGYQIVELDSGRSTENEYWDEALSAGQYSFGLANDDLHYPDRSHCIAIRCNFLCTPSARYEDIRTTLLNGCYYSMRVPDYGRGDWSVKYAKNRTLPRIENIGLQEDKIYISLSQPADSIKVTGQGHATLRVGYNTDSLGYTLKADDPYARFTAYFHEGEVIWSNPFARYDAEKESMPTTTRPHEINITFSILFNLMIIALCAGLVVLLFKIFRR